MGRPGGLRRDATDRGETLSTSEPGGTNSSAEEVARLLLDAGCVEVSLGRPFALPGGVLSPIEIRPRRLIARPRALREVVERMREALRAGTESYEVVAASGAASMVLAARLAERLALPMVFVRAQAKRHGTMRRIEGVLPSGSRVLLVADALSTEVDLTLAVDALGAAGSRVDRCVTVLDHQMGVEADLRALRVPTTALCDVATVLRVARRERRLSEEAVAAVHDWLTDPTAWSLARARASEEAEADARKVAKALLAIKAVALDAAHPFRYASGLLSPIYTDNRLLLSHPKEWKTVLDGYETLLRERVGVGRIDALAGTALSGIPHASRLAERLDLPMVYLAPRASGEEGEEVHGELHPGDRLVVIEDLVTTGRSVLTTAEALRAHGARIDWCVAIFTYDRARAREALRASGLALEALCDLPTLLEVAVGSGAISAADREEVARWIADPEGWAAQRAAPPPATPPPTTSG